MFINLFADELLWISGISVKQIPLYVKNNLIVLLLSACNCLYALLCPCFCSPSYSQYLTDLHTHEFCLSLGYKSSRLDSRKPPLQASNYIEQIHRRYADQIHLVDRCDDDFWHMLWTKLGMNSVHFSEHVKRSSLLVFCYLDSESYMHFEFCHQSLFQFLLDRLYLPSYIQRS